MITSHISDAHLTLDPPRDLIKPKMQKQRYKSAKAMMVWRQIPKSFLTKKGPGVTAVARAVCAQMEQHERDTAIAYGWFPEEWRFLPREECSPAAAMAINRNFQLDAVSLVKEGGHPIQAEFKPKPKSKGIFSRIKNFFSGK